MVRKNSVKEKKTAKTQSSAGDDNDTDVMTQCVLLCQEQRWREALLLCRRAGGKKNSKGVGDSALGLSAAQVKIERSLRRQMSSALITEIAELLQKEYLLDVSE